MRAARRAPPLARGGLAAALLSMAATLALGATPDASWLTDLDRARSEAGRLGRPVLLVFAGSDWAPWCRRLDVEVLATDEFRAWSRERVVPCYLDLPRGKGVVTPAERAAARAARDRYAVDGYPVVLLVEPDGTEVCRTQYRPGGSRAYVEHLEELLRYREAVRRYEGEYGGGKGEAPRAAAEAAAVASALVATCPEPFAPLLPRLCARIWRDDPDDKTGRRPQAAYLMAALATPAATEAELYLEARRGNDAGRFWERLQLVRLETPLQELLKALEGAERPAWAAPGVRSRARAVLLGTELLLPLFPDEAPIRAGLLLRRGLALAALGRLASAERALAEAEALGAPADAVTPYREHLKALQ